MGQPPAVRLSGCDGVAQPPAINFPVPPWHGVAGHPPAAATPGVEPLLVVIGSLAAQRVRQSGAEDPLVATVAAQQQEIERRTNLFARSTHSAFCPRPQEIPFIDPRGR